MTANQRVREHRERKKALRLFSDVSSAIQKQISEDLKFDLAYNEKGILVITWDIHKSTEDFLKGYAAAKGMTLDELMDYFNKAIIVTEMELPGTYERAIQNTITKAIRRN